MALVPVRFGLVAPNKGSLRSWQGHRDDGVGTREVSEKTLEVAPADAGSGACGGQREAVIHRRGVCLGLTDVDEAGVRACGVELRHGPFEVGGERGEGRGIRVTWSKGGR
jgi:hypothetical protein